MKVYVDFKDLDAEDMPSSISNKYNLQVRSINGGSDYKNVEIMSLADHTKQVKKEVIENLKQEIIYYPVGLLGIDGKSHKNTLGISKEILESYFEKILDQIQGE